MKVKALSASLVVLMLTSLLAACGNSSTKESSAPATASSAPATEAGTSAAPATANGATDPFGRYDETVTVTVGAGGANAADDAHGETMENNQYLKMLESRTNIKVKYSWLVDDANYDQKVTLAIASGDIPDVMVVRKQSQLNQLVEAGMVEDLTAAFNQTASPYVKGFFDSYKDRAFTTAKFDEKLMGIPDLTPGYQFPFLWVRQDWMDAVGAKAPKTLDDITNLAKTFMEKDPGGNGAGKTIGITAALNPHIAGDYNSFNNMEPVFGTYNAFPRQWIKDASGQYVYGSLSPETKQGLAKIAELYKAGLIDKEFAVRKMDDVNALLLSGKAGIFFGPWWMPDYPLGTAWKTNPKAVWTPYLAPLDANGNFNVYQQNPHTSWVVVKKGFKHPEVVLKMLNISYETSRHFNKDWEDTYGKENYKVWSPIYLMLQYEDAIPRESQTLQKAIESKDPSKLDPEPLNFYNSMLKYLATPPDLNSWSTYGTRILGSAVASTPDLVKIKDNAYPGITPTMETKWANLDKLENEAFLKIILGNQPIDSFDKFVDQWKAQGGNEITKEVNDALSKN
ncbi:unnamed protein product [Aphanomyces euteiches]